jgi:hypothetical protein
MRERTSPILTVLSTGAGACVIISGRNDKIDRINDLPLPSFRRFGEAIMNEEAFNVSLRKFLKKVGITSQREIEKAVRAALANGKLKGHEALPAKVSLAIGAVGLAVEIDGAIELE